MRLQPIEKPKGLMMWFAFRMVRRELGKVISPMKVLLPRMPALLKLAYEIQKLELKKIRLEPELHFLLSSHTAQINGCSFCGDITRAVAVRRRIGTVKFDALPDFRTSQLFSERERAALAYVEETTRHRHVADATFEALQRHFSESEIVEITWINAIENYHNLINLPLQIESDGLCAIAEARMA